MFYSPKKKKGSTNVHYYLVLSWKQLCRFVCDARITVFFFLVNDARLTVVGEEKRTGSVLSVISVV